MSLTLPACLSDRKTRPWKEALLVVHQGHWGRHCAFWWCRHTSNVTWLQKPPNSDLEWLPDQHIFTHALGEFIKDSGLKDKLLNNVSRNEPRSLMQPIKTLLPLNMTNLCCLSQMISLQHCFMKPLIRDNRKVHSRSSNPWITHYACARSCRDSGETGYGFCSPDFLVSEEAKRDTHCLGPPGKGHTSLSPAEGLLWQTDEESEKEEGREGDR